MMTPEDVAAIARLHASEEWRLFLEAEKLVEERLQAYHEAREARDIARTEARALFCRLVTPNHTLVAAVFDPKKQ